MRAFLRAASIALGLTELYSLVLLAPLLHPRHAAVYHWTGAASTLFLPTFLDLAVLWGLFLLVLGVASRWPQTRVAIWAALILLTPWIVSTEWILLDPTTRSLPPVWLTDALLVAGLLLVALWRRSLPSAARWGIHFASTVLFFFGIGGACLLLQLAWCGWQARASSPTPPPPHTVASAPPPSQPKSRILWIVFDELSFQQLYEHRFPGLNLPAFDALAAQSTRFTDVVPAGIFTDRVLPALLSGTPIDDVRASCSRRLLIHHPATGAWEPFNQHQTVFEDAHTTGYRTAVVGWYLPYCRLLPDVLDRCVSSYRIGIRNGMSPAFTIGRNMLQPAAEVLARLLPAASFIHPALTHAELHIADYQNLTEAANPILDDPTLTFVLLHLPVPHLEGIYNRATGQLTPGPSTYLDNLALADRSLAALRAQLERNGQWDRTTIVLMGDHSWRTTQMWKTESAWTTEEDQASRGGTFDPRPAYLVKLPHQHTAEVIAAPFAALQTRALLAALARQELHSPEELSAWAAHRP